MYAALGFKRFIVPLAITGVVIYLALLAVFHQIYPNDYGFMSFLRPIGWTVTIMGLLAAIASTRRVFWGIISVMEQIGVKIFPNINGKWKGETESNLKMISQLIQAASGRKNPIDFFEEEPELAKDCVEIEIKASLFNITFTAESGRAKTHSLKVLPDPAHDGYPDRLFVIFKSRLKLHDPLHDKEFHGSAIIDVKREEEDIVLDGRYWTDSRWYQGLAEAGKIKSARRVLSRQNSAQPKASIAQNQP